MYDFMTFNQVTDAPTTGVPVMTAREQQKRQEQQKQQEKKTLREHGKMFGVPDYILQKNEDVSTDTNAGVEPTDIVKMFGFATILLGIGTDDKEITEADREDVNNLIRLYVDSGILAPEYALKANTAKYLSQILPFGIKVVSDDVFKKSIAAVYGMSSITDAPDKKKMENVEKFFPIPISGSKLMAAKMLPSMLRGYIVSNGVPIEMALIGIYLTLLSVGTAVVMALS